MGDKAGVTFEGGSGSSGGGGGEKFRGVRMRKWGKWVAEVRLPKSRERIWLGSYDTQEKAARAYDAAQFCLRGPAAQFNFPNNPPVIPSGRSLTPTQIQVAASQFAYANDEIDHQSHLPDMSSTMQEGHPDQGAKNGHYNNKSQNNETDKSRDLVTNLADSLVNSGEFYNQCLGAFASCPVDIAGGSSYLADDLQTVHEELEDYTDENGAIYQPWGPLWNF